MKDSRDVLDADGHARSALAEFVLCCLPADAGREVELHLDACAACRVELSELFAVTTALSLLDEQDARAALEAPPEPVPTFVPEPDRTRRPRRTAVLRLAAVAGGLSLLAGFMAGIGLRGFGQDGVAVAAAEADDTVSGISLDVWASVADGGVALSATIAGLPPGVGCTAFVVTRDGVGYPVGRCSSDRGLTTMTGTVALSLDELAYFTAVGDDGVVLALAWFQR